jgi:hypothetical protein
MRELGATDIVILAILGMAGFWAIILTVISHAGGWASLAEQYRCREIFTGPRWSLPQGSMRWLVGYNHCLTVGADLRGLYLSIIFPLCISHPPLFIPWRDISSASGQFLWVKYVELRLGRQTVIPLRISLPLAQKIKSAAGTSWPLEAVA